MQLNFTKQHPQTPRRQQGVVLLIVLIMLVAMTLAGIGMMRSVDTASIVAGNLAFKQSTINAADGATSSAYNALIMIANSGNPQDKLMLSLNPGQNCPVGVTPGIIALTFCPGGIFTLPGYSSTPINACEVTNTCAAAPPGCPNNTYANWYQCAALWAGALPIPVPNPVNPAQPIATVSYLIHRMCTVANTVPSVPIAGNLQICQSFTPPPSQKTIPPPPSPPAFFYRVTSRSVGPRNTVSYTQTLVLIAQ